MELVKLERGAADPELVRTVEDFLKAVKEGKIVAVTCVGATHDMDVIRFSYVAGQSLLLLAGLEIAAHWIKGYHLASADEPNLEGA